MKELLAIRAARSLQKADGNPFYAAELTEHNDPIVSQYLKKSAVTGSSLSDSLSLASETVAHELGKYIFAQSVAGKLLEKALNLPFGTAIAAISGIGADWVKEGAGIALQKGNTSRDKTELYKVASMTAVSNELLRLSSTDSDRLIRDVITSSSVKVIDDKFLSADKQVDKVSPQGILFNAETASTMTELLEKHLANDNDLSKSGLILPISEVLKLTEAQFKQFELLGVSLIASQRTNKVILVDASNLVMRVEGTLIDTTNQSAIEMTDSATGNITDPASNNVVSLYQTNTAAFRAVTYCSWAVLGKAVTVLAPKD
ncbi:phage major capsid protein [Arsenophonus nasoniae]|uniref:Phage major capsid protein n=1 Tax=Arsenophonus nasoniae TaxID=638 RepID=A0AA95GCR6_9GAMM|nr:phage major capsid protein [Arsenophonus nasoniae]WGL93754.1 phage major capsid protein [Arsenophonus nasoniae]WGL96034.1 phage major capsid protein [Arsenophonus nasoniae]